MVVFRGHIPKSSVTSFDKRQISPIDHISLKNDFLFENQGIRVFRASGNESELKSSL